MCGGNTKMTQDSEMMKMLQDGLNLSSDKKIYFNGFTLSITPSDVIIVLQRDNQVVTFLNTTHIIAKTLMVKLQSALEGFENDTEFHIPNLDNIVEILKKKQDADTNRNA
jgi:uncharacterized protein (DUF1499 family)